MSYTNWKPVTDTQYLPMWKWLDKYAINMTRQQTIRVLIKNYGLHLQGAEEIYNEWRREYIEV